MVGPTKRKPRLTSSFESASDSLVWAGISFSDLQRVDARPAAHERPDEGVERAELLLDLEERPGVADRRGDLGAVPDDPAVGEKLLDPRRGEARHLVRIEAGEGAPVPFAPLKNRPPRQPRLRPLQDQELEVAAVVVHGHAPLRVVVRLHQRIGGSQPAAPACLCHAAEDTRQRSEQAHAVDRAGPQPDDYGRPPRYAQAGLGADGLARRERAWTSYST